MKAERKYQTLTKTCFKGSWKGMLRAVMADLHERPQRIIDFKAAISNGDVKIPRILGVWELESLKTLGVEPPKGFIFNKYKRKGSIA